MILLTNDKLPYCACYTGPIGRVVQAKCRTHDGFTILTDGSLLKLYQITQWHLPSIVRVIDSLENDCQVQLYKVHTKQLSSYYLVVQKTIDNVFKNVSWRNFFRDFLNPEVYYKDFIDNTKDAKRFINSTNGSNFVEIPYFFNDLLSPLIEREDSEMGLCPIEEPRINLSALLTGPSRVSKVFSLNNFSLLPRFSTPFLNEIDYVQCFSVIRPSRKRNNEIVDYVTDQIRLLKIFSTDKNIKNQNVQQVHTLIGSTESKIIQNINSNVYINCTFLIHAGSFSELEIKTNQFNTMCENSGVLLFHHINSTRNEYVSLFPGNAHFSDHMFLATKPFVNLLVDRIFSF